MKPKTLFFAFSSLVTNVLSRKKIVLVSEPASWAIYEDCRNIQNNLVNHEAVITYLPCGLRNKIIHFASENTYLARNRFRDNKWYEKLHPSNRIILTWFHISEEDSTRLHLIPLLNDRVDYVHTASLNTKRKLISYGLREEKVIVIPLGVDTNVFHPVSSDEKCDIRKGLGIPEKSIVIGSFQKDGNGWGAGLDPKLIKGPDVFCDVVERLAATHQIHVLLTGPARGYVKQRLESAGIPYTHAYLKRYADVAQYYQALDLYLITSREEGGPKAVLEALASGIPLISTSVGMAPEIIVNGTNGFITSIADVEGIVEYAIHIINNPSLQSTIKLNGRKMIQRYSLKKTVGEMSEKLYSPLLKYL
jgi:glycosyltransferase involved in cell wall biosynthesis